MTEHPKPKKKAAKPQYEHEYVEKRERSDSPYSKIYSKWRLK